MLLVYGAEQQQSRCGVILAMGLLDQNSVRTDFILKWTGLYTLELLYRYVPGEAVPILG